MSLISHLRHIDDSNSSGWNLGRNILQQTSTGPRESSSGLCSNTHSDVYCYQNSNEFGQGKVNCQLLGSSVVNGTLNIVSEPGDVNRPRSKGRPGSRTEFGRSSETVSNVSKDLRYQRSNVDSLKTKRPKASSSWPQTVGHTLSPFVIHDNCEDHKLPLKLGGIEAQSPGKLQNGFIGNWHIQRDDSGNYSNHIPCFIMDDKRSSLEPFNLISSPRVDDRIKTHALLPLPSRAENAKTLRAVGTKSTNEDTLPSKGLDPDSVRGRLLRQKGFTIPRIHSSNTSVVNRGNDVTSDRMVRPQATIDVPMFYSDNLNGNATVTQSRKPATPNREKEPGSGAIGPVDNFQFSNTGLESDLLKEKRNLLNKPEHVLLNCPSCKEVQNVLYCPGITHTCTGCSNIYQLVDKSVRANAPKNEQGSPKPGGSKPKKSVSTPRQVRPRKRTRNKPECVTISSDEEEVNVAAKVNMNSSTQELANDCSKTVRLSEKMKLQGGIKPNESVKHVKTTHKESLSVNVNFIQFGSVAGKALQPMDLSEKGILLRVGMTSEHQVKSQQTDEFVAAGSFTICLEKNHIRLVKLYVGRSPSLLVIYPTEAICSQINSKFEKVVLKVSGGDFIQNQILITLSTNPVSESTAEEIVQEIRVYLLRMCEMQLMSQKEAEHIYTRIQSYEVSNRVCNSKLSSSTSNTITPNTSTPASTLKTETLLVYPKPAAHGSITITADDIECLADGVYLNDVIIDFYLRYLLESMLKDEDRKRTHLFSSFFYKRLTQKTPRYNLSEEMAKLSLPERMHQLVKNWTRNIDIFEKDFILIPVNEHSHWYLVIICFPAMVPVEIDPPLEPRLEGGPSDSEEASNTSVMETEDNHLSQTPSPMEIDENIQSPTGNSYIAEIAPVTAKCLQEAASSTAKYLREPGILNASKPLSAAFPCRPGLNLQDLWNPVPCILIFDSLGLKSSNRVFTNLRNYLTQEWKAKRPGQKMKVFDKDTMKGSFPKLPLQSNDCDCGIYVLQYAETFFTSPITNFKFPIKKEDWFSKEVVNKKRKQIGDLIYVLKDESQKDSND